MWSEASVPELRWLLAAPVWLLLYVSRVWLADLVFGLAMAIGAGWVQSKLRLECWPEPWAQKVQADTAETPAASITWPERLHAGTDAVRKIVGRVRYWIIAGTAVGAPIHDYAPEELLAAIMGKVLGGWYRPRP